MLLKITSLVISFLILNGISTLTFSQTIKTDLKTLSVEAELVFLGKVVDQKSNWSSDHSKIYTEVTILVEELIKGSPDQNEIIVRHLGGEVGDVGELYSHMPSFTRDEEVLLFARKESDSNKYKIYSGVDGKITVYTDPNTGEKVTASNRKLSTLKNEVKSYISTN